MTEKSEQQRVDLAPEALGTNAHSLKEKDLSRFRLSLLFYSFAALSSVYLILLKTQYAEYLPWAGEGIGGFTSMWKDIIDGGMTGSTSGHINFGDGRKTVAAFPFIKPKSPALDYVNVMLGNGGSVGLG